MNRALNQQTQRGAVLAVAMIVLMVLTLIGLVSIQATSLDAKLSGNLRDLNLAMQSTESSLREAENLIETLVNTNGFGVGSGLYAQGTAPDPFTAGTWTGATSIVSTGNYGSVVQPRFFIEFVGNVGGDLTGPNVTNYGGGSSSSVSVFRVVARGTGATGTAQVILESFYGRQF